MREKLEKDILVLTLRLMGEDPDTFSPEVQEVMKRWIPEARRNMRGGNNAINIRIP